jgi:hypothetical protein
MTGNPSLSSSLHLRQAAPPAVQAAHALDCRRGHGHDPVSDLLRLTLVRIVWGADGELGLEPSGELLPERVGLRGTLRLPTAELGFGFSLLGRARLGSKHFSSGSVAG